MDDLKVGRFTIPGDAVTERFETSGGPGGQHANRSETAVRLSLDLLAAGLPDEVRGQLVEALGEVVQVSASESRSQFRNRAMARQRLIEKLESALVGRETRRWTKPTRASRKRRRELKRARSETKRLRRRPRIGD
jgi:ribosome-associated protein